MKRLRCLIAVFCIVLLVTLPIVTANHIYNDPYLGHTQGQPTQFQQDFTGGFFQSQFTNPQNQFVNTQGLGPTPFNQYAVPSSFRTDPYFGSSLGGYTYNTPY